MIKTQKMTPEVYYNKSRDFQLFGRLYDVIFNYLKNNVSAVTDITTNLNPNQKILELMCNTLGFKTTHIYDNEQLSALCSIFLQCMKAKGTAKSVLLLLKMVCCIENSTEDVLNPNPEYNLKITVAGMPTDCHKYVNFDNFNIGSSYKGKKQPKIVPGGVVLSEIDFTIKRV